MDKFDELVFDEATFREVIMSEILVTSNMIIGCTDSFKGWRVSL